MFLFGLRVLSIGLPRVNLSLAAGILVFCGMPSTSLAQAAAGSEAIQPWITCLVEKSRSMASAPDGARTVAEAAMALCQSGESPVRAMTERSAEANLIRDGVVADAAEARRVVQSVRDEGWSAYRSGMIDQVAAVIVQMRAKQRPKEGLD